MTNPQKILALLLGGLLSLGNLLADPGGTCPEKAVQEQKQVELKKLTPDDVYKNLPYQVGENAKYRIEWAGIHAGYMSMQVLPPVQEDGIWHQVFGFDASTGDWFRHVYIGRYSGKGFVVPGTREVSKFRLQSYRDPPFKSATSEDKWITFKTSNCEVEETIQENGGPLTKETHFLEPGSEDSLGVFFHLRAEAYKVGEKKRFLVYSSGKNWYLETEALGEEDVEVPLGKFKAMKLKLQTFIGKELQQKGDVLMWIASHEARRPLVQIRAKIKLGSVNLLLEKL